MPDISRQAILMHVLHLLQNGGKEVGIDPFSDRFQVIQEFVRAKFVGLFVRFIFKFDGDTVVHFEYGNLQVGVFNIADYAHNYLAKNFYPVQKCKKASW